MARNKNMNELNENQRSMVAHYQPKSPITELYRTIRTNLQFTSIDSAARVISVTSSGPGEGKSTTAVNLAIVSAQQGKKVLLIDADMRKPTAHYTFSKLNTLGLTNYLTNQKKLQDLMEPTEVPNLMLLTSGPIPPNPAELLDSKATDRLIEEALNYFDYVIFDTPPVLAVTDAQILGNKSDGVVLVVNSGNTKRDEALKAKDLLLKAKAKILGVVLNRKERKSSQYYYYYGEKNS